MHADSSLGMMDNSLQRAPNATIASASGKVKANQNNTLGWLELRPEDQQEKLVPFSISQGVVVRQRLTKRQKETEAAVYVKYEKVRADLEKNPKLKIRRVGLCNILMCQVWKVDGKDFVHLEMVPGYADL